MPRGYRHIKDYEKGIFVLSVQIGAVQKTRGLFYCNVFFNYL